MGFALTILYLVTTYLGTDTVFGPLANYHVALIIALFTIVVSLPSLTHSFVLKTPQSLALAGLALAVFMSVLATGWVGGAIQAFQEFIPNAFAYFLVCLHCNSRRKLKLLVLLLLFVCMFVIVRGSMELRNGVPQNPSGESTATLGGQRYGDYLMGMQNDAGQWFFRLRGKGFINDPNDFAQFIACVLPLVFVFWRPKERLRNTLCVLLPACALLYGSFLTHSRGFMVAFLAMAFVAGRRRIGTLPSLIIGIGLYVAASALHFTGGRDVSIDAGSGRMSLWGGGLGVLKSHPFFGVGFGRLPDFLEGYTAHNSIVVCAAELGLFGLFFWSLFLFPTLRGAWVLVSPSKSAAEEAAASDNSGELSSRGVKVYLERSEVARMGQLTLLSLIGFLVAGLFLSRAFVLTLFLIGGIEEVIYEMAQQQGMTSPRLRLDRVLVLSGVFAIIAIVVVYVTVKTTMP